jgi:hypothetical protein
MIFGIIDLIHTCPVAEKSRLQKRIAVQLSSQNIASSSGQLSHTDRVVPESNVAPNIFYTVEECRAGIEPLPNYKH